MSVTKEELIGVVATGAGITRAAAGAAIAALLDGITDGVRRGDRITLRGFGTFQRKHTAARQGRNPSTGAVIDVPASTSMKFKAAGKL